MFKLLQNGCQNPTDIRFIDWQLIRESSPVFDVSYFFYTIASEEALQKLDYHLKVYHDELRYRIKQLGSDPDVLYPEKVFREEWKQHCKFGYAMAFVLIKMMLSDKDEVTNIEGMDWSSAEESEKMIPKLKDETEFLRRMRALTVHMITNDFI